MGCSTPGRKLITGSMESFPDIPTTPDGLHLREAEYDDLGVNNVFVLVDVLSLLMHQSALALFCFKLQFKTWTELLKGDVEEVVGPSKQVDYLESENLPTRNTSTLEASAKAFNYVKTPGIDHKNLRIKSLYPMFVTNCLINIQRSGIPGLDILQHVV